MSERLRAALTALASLRLTVVLLGLSMLLVLAGTLAQVDEGLWTVLHTYFRAWAVWVPFWYVPLPGGYLVGSALLINLLAAHAVRFRFTRQRLGVILIHLGLVMLLVGELVTALYAVESSMELNEGETVDFTVDSREVELVVIDPSSADSDLVVAIPQARLYDGAAIEHPLLPFRVKVESWLPNAEVLRGTAPPGAGPAADRGAGLELFARTEERVTGVRDRDRGKDTDTPAAYVTLEKDGQRLGTWLTSVYLQEQPVGVQGGTYLLALRFRRYVKDYQITLLDFRHDRYTGTEVPRNFSSQVRLVDPARGVDREVLIAMNQPLRYRGETFYQSSFRGEQTTILQVVRNPGWTVPYIAVSVGALGMLLHFGGHLLRFLRRSRAR